MTRPLQSSRREFRVKNEPIYSLRVKAYVGMKEELHFQIEISDLQNDFYKHHQKSDGL